MKKENTPNYAEVYDFSRKLGASVKNYEIASYKKGSDIIILRRTTPRILDEKTFIYENLEKEKQRNADYVKEVISRI